MGEQLIRPRAWPRLREVALISSLAFASLLSDCKGSSGVETVLSGETGAIFEAEANETCTGGRTFRFRVTDAEKIRSFDSRAGQGWTLIGTVRRGDGAVNAPWNWHLETNSADLVATALVACMLCPSDVQADPGDFVSGNRSFCMEVTVLPR